MATYHLTAPDGSAYEVDAPENAKPQDVYAVLNAHLKKQSANLSPLDKEMDTRVSKEAAQGLKPDYDYMAGTPIGSWMDEIVGGMNAGAHKLTGGAVGMPYEEGRAYWNAKKRWLDENSPKGQTAAALLGGAASVPYIPFKAFSKGGTLANDMFNAAVNAAPVGAIYGAGDDQGGGRANNAARGALDAAMFAGAVTPVMRGGAAVLTPLIDRAKALPSELSAFDRKAVNKMADLVQADKLAGDAAGNPAQSYGMSNFALKERELGPQGMIGDMGPSMRGIVTGMAKRPGSEEMSTVVNALEDRQKGAMSRLEGATDAALEKPVNVPDMLEAMRAQGAKMAKPWYDQFKAMAIKPTENLQRILDRANAIFTPQEGGLFPQVQQILKQDGIDPNMAKNNGLMIDGIKRAIDAKVSAAEKAGDFDAVRRFSSIASDLRNETDAILRSQGAYARDANGQIIRSKNGVGKSIYEQARDVSGEHIKVRKAFEDGQSAFAKGYSADQLAYDMRKMSADERFAYRLGARGQVKEMVDNASTKFGPNGDAREMSLIHTPSGQRKVEMLSATPQDARNLINTVKQETEFAKTAQPALANSVTQMAKAAQDAIPGAVETANLKLGTTSTGLAITAAEGIVNHLMHTSATERNIKTAIDMAKMAVARGADRNQIAQGLFKVINSRALTAQQRTAARRVANKILYASSTAYVEARKKAALANTR